MKCVILISTPRSNSVCITRILEQTECFNIFHEPYIPVYDKIHYTELTKEWWKNNSFNESKDVIEAIKTSDKIVLIKDMAFAIVDYYNHLPKESHFILLCRHPLDVIISFYNKVKQMNYQDELEIDNWRSLSGFYQLLAIKKKLIKESCNVLVIPSDNILQCVKSIFKFLNMEFKDEYTHWKPCTSETDVEYKSTQWKENKKNHLFVHWHKEALQSDGLHESIHHSLDEIENIKHREIIQQLTNELLLIYYELIN